MNKEYDEDGVKVTPPSENQKGAVGEVQGSTAEYSNLFKERGSALTSALTTKLPSEIELEEKYNKELDEGDVESVTPQDDEGIDYSQGATAREELLTEVGLFLADDYTTLKIRNDNLVKLFNLLKEKKLTFIKISNDSAKYPKESKLVEKVFKTSLTIAQAKQADEIMQQRIFKIPELEKQLNDLLQMQKRKGEPDFKSHDEKRKRGSMQPRQPEEEEKQKPSEMKESSWMRAVLRSIGRFLTKIFTREKIEIRSNPIYESKEVYEKSQRQDYRVHYNRAEDKVTITKKEDENMKEVSSEVKEGSITRVDSEKGRRGPG
ncbi:MAG: hypothetical protein PG981_001099 [Wolbachia endosymbiont of Ctenocephalides orientis wCori]|nr:MAG: hypothetical protein PG981_001099 [Wolbachia endosymbiont of Ctenocephalides orientis wCori]